MMAGNLWEGYLQRVLDSQDKILFQEAMHSARAKALRAAYIVIWLACAESLKRKFKGASQFDDVATKISAEIKDKEEKHQSIDVFLLTKAKEYGFISDSEFSCLNAIYEKRCIYGHPYEQEPLLEELIAAAASVVEYVLSRPVKLRHGYLDRQVHLICTNMTFLDDHFPAVESYARIVHSRSSTDLHLWFLRKLWKHAWEIAKDPSMELFVRRVVWFTTAFLGHCSRDFFDNWDVTQDVAQYPFISSALATDDLFPKISSHAKDIIVGNLLNAAKAQSNNLIVVEKLYQKGELTQRQIDRFMATISNIPLNVLASSGVHPQLYVDNMIGTLKSHNWYMQNPVIDVIRDIGPSGIGMLPPEKQWKLGNNVLQAADGKANNAIMLLSELSRGDKEWPESFIAGIVAECLVDDVNKFRFKTKCAGEALACLRAVPAKKRASIIKDIVTRLKNARPKYQWSMENDRQNFLKAIDEAITNDTSGLMVLNKLKTAVAMMEIPKDG